MGSADVFAGAGFFPHFFLAAYGDGTVTFSLNCRVVEIIVQPTGR